jgi:hypothetical protein
MTSLAHVLAEAGPGVHVWHSPRPVAEVEAEAAEIAWRCVVLDGENVRDKACFLEKCERAYRFPPWFGHNWDALADCMADLGWLPPPAPGSGGGILTVFEHGDDFARADLDAYDTALEVWEEVAEAWRRVGVPFTVLVRPGAEPDADDGPESAADD